LSILGAFYKAATGGVTASSTNTFTNKTVDGDGTGNTYSNMLNISGEQTAQPISYTKTGVGNPINSWTGKFFQVPTTYKFIEITDIEYKDGSSGSGNAIAAVFGLSSATDPPTDTNLPCIGFGAESAFSTNTVQKTTFTQLGIIKGGANLWLGVNIDTLNQKKQGQDGQSGNMYFAETYSANPNVNRTGISWVTWTDSVGVKIYYVGFS